MNQKYALVGFPLSHAISPEIHNRLFALAGDKTSSYEAIELSRTRFCQEKERLLAYDGLNVTIPYKISIVSILDRLDISAKRYGAVNTVRCGKGRESIGYNTDVDGFLRALKELGTSLSGKVLLLGCGGAGRMMAIETARAKGSLTIAVRESSYEGARSVRENILALDEKARVKIAPLDGIPNESFDLILNATPVGMYPNGNESPIDPAVLQRTSYLFDAIYNPAPTLLIRRAQACGVKTAGGMSMLVWQAVAAHEIWSETRFSTDDVERLILQMHEYVRTFDESGDRK